MSINEFVSTYTGKQITDNSGGYKGECVSLAKRYAKEVLGILNADSVLYCPNGAAKDMYELFDGNGRPDHFIRVPYGEPRQRGDLVVWGTNLGRYGDVAVALDTGNLIFGQLGTPAFIPANSRIETRPPLGYLRLKKGVPSMTPDQARVVAFYLRLLDFESVDEANSHLNDDVQHIVADPGYAGALAQQIYTGEKWQKINAQVVDYGNLKARADGLQTELEAERKGYEAQIADLKAQVASAGNSSDSVQLNALGAALRWLIQRLGLKG